MTKKILWSIVLIFITGKSFSSHLFGGELTYTCVGNHQYQVNYTLYIDCNGNPAPPVSIPLRADTQSFTLLATTASPQYLEILCPTATSSCNSGPYPGFEKWIYSGIITVNPGSTIISSSLHARSLWPTTISNSGNDSLYVNALIVDTMGICNNSPIFNYDPTITLCAGTMECIPALVTDPDGDSLSYRLIAPRIGPLLSDTVPFLSGYSTLQPFTSNSPITLNSISGELCLTPMIPGESSIIAIQISEYRNGILIGQILKDITMFVINCTSPYPGPTGFDGLPFYTVNVCALTANCFYITASQPDTNLRTFISIDHSIPSIISYNSGGNRDTLFVCWTPSDSDTLTNPHYFYCEIKNDACPYSGTVHERYSFNVIPSSICNPNSIIEQSGKTNFSIFPNPANNELHIKYTNISSDYFALIYSVDGRLIQKFSLNESKSILDIHSLTDGMYFIKLVNVDGSAESGWPFVVIR